MSKSIDTRNEEKPVRVSFGLSLQRHLRLKHLAQYKKTTMAALIRQGLEEILPQ